MLVFIDESGDPGFKLEQGASSIFVAAMVIFQTSEAALATQTTIEQSEVRRLHKPKEFKFNKCSFDVRDRFFATVRGCDFSVRAIVVRKNIIYSKALKGDKEKFHEFFVRQMMNHDNGALRNANVIIDGSGDREFKRNLGSALRSRESGVKSVRFRDSKSDALLQLSDMCVGAIARSYSSSREEAFRWREMIKHKIVDVWEFR